MNPDSDGSLVNLRSRIDALAERVITKEGMLCSTRCMGTTAQGMVIQQIIESCIADVGGRFGGLGGHSEDMAIPFVCVKKGLRCAYLSARALSSTDECAVCVVTDNLAQGMNRMTGLLVYTSPIARRTRLPRRPD